MEEPTVLDYVKALLTPWNKTSINIPEVFSAEDIVDEKRELVSQEKTTAVSHPSSAESAQAYLIPGQKAAIGLFPWRAGIGLLTAMVGQWELAPPNRSPRTGILLLLICTCFVIWAFLKKEWRCTAKPDISLSKDALTFDIKSFGIGILFALIVFFTSGGNRFSLVNLLFLILSLIFLFRAFWMKQPSNQKRISNLLSSIKSGEWQFSISRWFILFVAATVLVVFFRLNNLVSLPVEMVSDHAEKYLDVFDILNGQTKIFFPRNGGREALQFYLITSLLLFFNAKVNFLTLKISTTLIGLLALPIFYLLGKEIGSRRVGYLVFIFAGTAYWMNVISRAGMRLPFYVLFTAATLYFLIKGFNTSNRNYFLICGLFLGLGMYGYSANRILPIVLIVAIALFLVHSQSKGYRRQVVIQSGLLFLIALVVYTPLLRYSIQDPAGYSSRVFSRLGTSGAIPVGELLSTFFTNTFDALSMFSWSAGVVWVTSIPEYPALGIVSGAFFYIGALLILLRYIYKRRWLDIFILISIPLLMLPSILSLAFPGENPNLYRTGGAAVPAFLLIGLAFEGLMTSLEERIVFPWGSRVAWGTFAALFILSAALNYDLVFNKYHEQYRLSAQNTSELGEVIHGFIDTGGSPESAWVMGFPHWVDTRLVSITAGYPHTELALFSDQVKDTLEKPAPKLFIVHPEDKTSIDMLPQIYDNGWFQRYNSAIEAKDFLLFFVPRDEAGGQG